MVRLNPRSRITQMKARYFFSTFLCYLIVFAIFFMFAELIFMIRETSPSMRLLIVVILMIADIAVTKKIINHSMLRWMRHDYSAYSPKRELVMKDEEVARDIEKKELREAKKDLRERQKKAREEKRQEKRKEVQPVPANRKHQKRPAEQKKQPLAQEHPDPSSVFQPRQLGQDLSDEEINRVLHKLVDEGTLESADKHRKDEKQESDGRN